METNPEIAAIIAPMEKYEADFSIKSFSVFPSLLNILNINTSKLPLAKANMPVLIISIIKTGINKEPFIKLGRKSKVIRHTISAPFPNTNINFLSNLSDK